MDRRAVAGIAIAAVVLLVGTVIYRRVLRRSALDHRGFRRIRPVTAKRLDQQTTTTATAGSTVDTGNKVVQVIVDNGNPVY